ncbi:MAG: hypothetical protein DKT66_10200 [Candidatus Melainabacteria bacterium]|nr:MAG: hypothetical protein DKT66_10200 [Candidatus Melainabacteria bacterium]
MSHQSTAHDRAASAATELIAAVELITHGFQRRMQIDYVSLIDVLLPLTPEQHEQLVSFVISSGLDVNIFVALVRSGLDTQLYFDAIEHGAHPALPIALFMQGVQTLQTPVATKVLSDSSAMRQAIAQMQIVERVSVMLSRFLPVADNEERDNLAHAN